MGVLARPQQSQRLEVVSSREGVHHGDLRWNVALRGPQPDVSGKSYRVAADVDDYLRLMFGNSLDNGGTRTGAWWVRYN